MLNVPVIKSTVYDFFEWRIQCGHCFLVPEDSNEGAAIPQGHDMHLRLYCN